MLFASNISKTYSSGTLFSGITFNMDAGDRIALIGPNGSGKTTLMDILAGDTLPETGSISKKRNVTMGYLKQEPASFTGRPLLQEVLDVGPEVNALMDRIVATQETLSSETDPMKQGDLLKLLSQLDMELEAADGSDREHEAKAILSGLGFKQSDFPRPMGDFSGGWVMRASLARMLFRKPDLLLLDEPTNHLDLDANLWFEKYLASFQGGVLITSHDVDGQRKCPAKWPAKMSLVLLAMITDGFYPTRPRFMGGLTASMYFFAVARWMPSSRATPRIDSPLRFAF